MAISGEDKKIFRAAVADVKPLKVNNRHQPTRIHPTKDAKPTPISHKGKQNNLTPPSQRNFVPNTTDTIAITTQYQGNDVINFAKDGVSFKLSRRIKQGKLDETPPLLDLHGQTLNKAHNALVSFINRYQDSRYLQIIHGKGQHSQNNQAVLKNYTASFLMQQPKVLAFYSCPPNEGGTGAVFVLLSRRQ